MIFKTAVFDKKTQTTIIRFPINDKLALEKISKIPHAMMGYDFWEIPTNFINIQNLKRWGFEMSKSLLEWDDKVITSIPTNNLILNTRNELILRQYQEKGVYFIDAKNGRALLADDMGLGKTIQALSYLQLRKEKRPVLIICPGFLKTNWKRETRKWVDGARIQILSGETPYKIKPDKNVIIINYEILQYWMKTLRNFNFKVIIADEIQYIKSKDAQRTKAFVQLSRRIPHVIGLTGTPIENRPVEIYSIVNIIDSTIFPNYYSFINRFCGAKWTVNKGRGGWDASGSSNLNELHHILKNTIMLRRKKEDVLKELPPKQIVRVPLELSNKKEYKIAETEFIKFVNEKFSRTLDKKLEDELKRFAKTHDINVGDTLTKNQELFLRKEKIANNILFASLVQLKALQQLAIKGKLEEIAKWITNFLETGEKLVVFAIHKDTLDFLEKKFPATFRIDGSVSMAKRQNIIDDFQQNPEIKLLIANIKAGGVGSTLTAASNVVVIEFPWSPSTLNQAIDRLHRITQLKQVTAWLLMAKDSIDYRLMDILKIKENIISQVLDGKEFEDISVLMELINSYKIINKGK
jgi:SWI/SNF-related matrix-associated actin-dependent regulator 1 of chromatin subfamily A